MECINSISRWLTEAKTLYRIPVHFHGRKFLRISHFYDFAELIFMDGLQTAPHGNGNAEFCGGKISRTRK